MTERRQRTSHQNSFRQIGWDVRLGHNEVSRSLLTESRRFRWAFCQLDALHHSFPASIRGALNELQKGLDETYEKTLLSIDEVKGQYAQRLFQRLTVAIRPLCLDELAEVLAIRFNSDSLPSYNLQWRSGDAEEAVFSASSSLITLSFRCQWGRGCSIFSFLRQEILDFESPQDECQSFTFSYSSRYRSHYHGESMSRRPPQS